MFQEILELQDATMEWLRVGLTLSTSLCGLLSTRPLLQAHLHSAMVQWWTHRNAGRSLQVCARNAGHLESFPCCWSGQVPCMLALGFGSRADIVHLEVVLLRLSMFDCP